MRVLFSSILFLVSPLASYGFNPTPAFISPTKWQKSKRISILKAEKKEGESDKVSIINKAPTSEFNPDEELMYALGVNLARQLGDIRPLVENGEELTFVAKGLLDAVVGRLNEE